MLYSPVYILHDSYIGKINHEKTPEFPFILVLRVNLSAQLFLTFNKIYMEIKNINIYNIYIYIFITHDFTSNDPIICFLQLLPGTCGKRGEQRRT